MTMNIEIQDHSGDRKLMLNWKPGDETAEERIGEMFKDLQNAGYRFYSVKRVLGIFKKKDKEVKSYDKELGELIYEEPAIKKGISATGTDEEVGLKMYESEKQKNAKYEEPKKFNPDKESIDTSRDYVATQKMRAG